MEPVVSIEMMGGNCPVQAEGTIDGQRFYFRARGQRWSLEIHPTTEHEFVDWPEGDTWRHEEPWGDNEYAAGWMPIDTARAMINKAAKLYAAEKGKDHGG